MRNLFNCLYIASFTSNAASFATQANTPIIRTPVYVADFTIIYTSDSIYHTVLSKNDNSAQNDNQDSLSIDINAPIFKTAKNAWSSHFTALINSVALLSPFKGYTKVMVSPLHKKPVITLNGNSKTGILLNIKLIYSLEHNMSFFSGLYNQPQSKIMTSLPSIIDINKFMSNQPENALYNGQFNFICINIYETALNLDPKKRPSKKPVNQVEPELLSDGE